MVRTSDDSQLRGIPARSVATPATRKKNDSLLEGDRRLPVSKTLCPF